LLCRRPWRGLDFAAHCLKGHVVAKKVTKAPAKQPAAKKAEVSAKAPAPAKQAASALESSESKAAPAKVPAKAKAPVLPPRPVPAHQQFLGKGGVKPQHMNKARIIRHQGR